MIISILEVIFHLWQWDTVYFHNKHKNPNRGCSCIAKLKIKDSVVPQEHSAEGEPLVVTLTSASRICLTLRISWQDFKSTDSKAPHFIYWIRISGDRIWESNFLNYMKFWQSTEFRNHWSRLHGRPNVSFWTRFPLYLKAHLSRPLSLP